ncbi:hypothetical protein V1L54_23875 [Streptomyces sp. TRM 70361]|uniref:hypothetical protein n=1 Tax=Streptomyces sp. TRM 70361 TaxID=3116553 RepID=UPI002E7AB0FB|nr:hypothetical protein [Streptomyces sp. TRM 70361]MEE1942403.1 hypothetical protein [Streptomyces sp. TRM 70361]
MDRSTTAFERGCRIAADLVRAGALVSAAAAAFLPLEGVIRFLLLFLGLLVPRLAGVRSPVDLLVGIVLSVAAWSSPAHWYELAVWYDTALHAVVPGIVALTLHLLLIRWRLLPPLMANDLRIFSIPLLTTLLGCTVALVWELYEWFGKDVLGLEIAAHYDDTVADMAAGLVSSLVAGVLLAVWARHRARTRRRTRWSAPLT